MERRMIETTFTEEDKGIEGSLRPQKLDDYIGQKKIRESIAISIEADLHPCGKAPKRTPGPCPALWPARTRQDDAVGDHCQ